MTTEQQLSMNKSIIRQSMNTINKLLEQDISKYNEVYIEKMAKTMLQMKAIFELHQCSKTGNYNS